MQNDNIVRNNKHGKHLFNALTNTLCTHLGSIYCTLGACENAHLGILGVGTKWKM